ncbi:RagB/SusD family nutrient uptake outer membrane protein [Chitinophaga costaii]|nr:RagB/SusD family nutrient uptake outer membrane protein [Chitinophaga costaii]PUZ24696.1 RagB/SusD family nutrient uptake outer membrane protein [Chitinophaga costaii]
MKLKYILLYCVGAFTLVICACSGKLDLKPTDELDASTAYKTVTDLNKGLLGAYAGVSFAYIRNSALTSDECTLPADNTSGRNIDTYRWQNDASNTTITAPWEQNYIVIDRLNRVLAAADNINLKAGEEALRNQYKAELLALRAYCHFDLLRNFAEAYHTGALGVPYMFSAGIGSPARDNYEIVLQDIHADLAAAKALMPADFTDVTRITAPAISAIQARVALYNQEWDSARLYSTEAINAVPLATKASYGQIWLDQGTEEVIWKNKRTTDDALYIGDIFYDYGNGVALYVPSFELLDKFDKDNDIRFPWVALENPDNTPGLAPYIVNKYQPEASVVNLADSKLFRTGEMYLIRAEARAELDDLAGAAADLNALRAARINGYTPVSLPDRSSAIDAIYAERFKELAFEGHRYYDLRRRNLTITREPADVVNAAGAITLQPTDKGYIYPIPDAEMKANKNMQQNP